MSWLILLTYETSFTMRRATGITLTPHQIVRVPRKMNVMIDRAHIWNVISNAQSSKSHPPTSPNTGPATQNECHDWSCSRMKRHLQCAERQASPCNLTNYCACHAKLHSQILAFPMRDHARPIRAWSDHDPTTQWCISDVNPCETQPGRRIGHTPARHIIPLRRLCQNISISSWLYLNVLEALFCCDLNGSFGLEVWSDARNNYAIFFDNLWNQSLDSCLRSSKKAYGSAKSQEKNDMMHAFV